MSRGQPRQTTRQVSAQHGNPNISVSWQLQEIGVDVGDTVHVEPKGDYILIKKEGVSDRQVKPEDRDNIPDNPIHSRMEATTVGNRLWKAAQLFEDSGFDNVATETRHFARRFHAVANGSTITEDFNHD